MNASLGMSRLLARGPVVLWVMVAGGILWIVYGYFRFMTPQGPDVVWREDLGYSPILSNELYVLYNLPGVLALLLTLWASMSFLRTVSRRRNGMKRAALLVGVLASLFGVVALAGQVILFDPLKTLGLALGTPLLGLAMLLGGLITLLDGRGSGGRQGLLVAALILLGVTGLFTLLLRPLMFAFALIPLAFGAAASSLFGAAWILLAFSLRNEPGWMRSRPAQTAVA